MPLACKVKMPVCHAPFMACLKYSASKGIHTITFDRRNVHAGLAVATVSSARK